jgi:PleD family two-component response regulator
VTGEEDEQTFFRLQPNDGHQAQISSLAIPTRNAPLILVLDDNADMRRYVERILRKDYRIILAKDGAEPFEQTQCPLPGIGVTDVMRLLDNRNSTDRMTLRVQACPTPWAA